MQFNFVKFLSPKKENSSLFAVSPVPIPGPGQPLNKKKDQNRENTLYLDLPFLDRSPCSILSVEMSSGGFHYCEHNFFFSISSWLAASIGKNTLILLYLSYNLLSYQFS